MGNKRIIIFEESSASLMSNEYRLNASSFSPEAAIAMSCLSDFAKKGGKLEKLESLISSIFYPTRFKRNYTNNGRGFLSSKEIFDLIPKGKRIAQISKEYLIEPGWILLTRSGTVGRVLVANKLIAESAISEHVIRIVPKADAPIGYIYAFLSSRIGQALIARNIFGGVVDEIEPQHLAELDVPIISNLGEKINEIALTSIRLREEAQLLLLDAQERLKKNLNLPSLDENGIEYLGPNKKSRCFEINSSQLGSRLDASYYNPIALLAVSTLMKSKSGEIQKLGSIADTFVPKRFKRAYVKDPLAGIPLLQGSHVSQFKPQDAKFIWGEMKNINEYIVQKNWILVTASGTIGKVSTVNDYLLGWAATNHILRVLPHESDVHPGYLTAYLQSDYGWAQFQRLSYGSVVDEIAEAGELVKDILILRADNRDDENEIGEIVLKAYEKIAYANKLEDNAISILETSLNLKCYYAI